MRRWTFEFLYWLPPELLPLLLQILIVLIGLAVIVRLKAFAVGLSFILLGLIFLPVLEEAVIELLFAVLDANTHSATY